jgi:hypothetical protein
MRPETVVGSAFASPAGVGATALPGTDPVPLGAIWALTPYVQALVRGIARSVCPTRIGTHTAAVHAIQTGQVIPAISTQARATLAVVSVMARTAPIV